MEDLISIIVPVYNSEKHIRGCVESVLLQTYSAFELILIEDGSKDESLKVCETFCKKDKRIRLIQQSHKGVSAARNIGIEAARGKYLFFMDSDDMIHPQLLEALYKLQEENHTVIAAEGLHYSADDDCRQTTAWKKTVNCTARSFCLDNKKALKYLNKVTVCAIGGKMILRRAIKTIRFAENLSHNEDKLFIYQLLADGADFSVLCCNWYYYRRHGENASRDFSEEACWSRYRVERYICNCELRSGRMENAIYREWDIVAMMKSWYGTGRIHQDLNLVKCTKNLAKKEKKLKIFHQLYWWMKLYFYLTFYCYPLLEVSLKVFNIVQTALKFIKK